MPALSAGKHLSREIAATKPAFAATDRTMRCNRRIHRVEPPPLVEGNYLWMKKNGDRRDWHKDCTLPATMKQFGAKSRLALAAAAAVLVAACSVGAVPGPKYVPESTTILGPEPQIPNLFVGCWRAPSTDSTR